MIKILSGTQFSVVSHGVDGWQSFVEQLNLPIPDSYIGIIKNRLQKLHIDFGQIYEISIFYDVYLTCFCDREKEKIYVLGPVADKSFSESRFKSLLGKLIENEKILRAISDYVLSLPSVHRDILHNLSICLTKKLYGDPFPVSHKNINLLWDIREAPEPKFSPPPADLRKIENRYEFSKVLTEAVKQGNYSLAVQIMYSQNDTTAFEVRNKNPLRNMQNICIISNTQMRHALEDSGVHPYKLDRLSHSIGLKIEQLQSVKEAEEYIKTIIQLYCALVREYNYPGLSPVVHLAITYIKDHLSDNISVKETARALSVNANYLSGVFRRETGVCFIDFLNKERVTQAASLLQNSNLQIQQIASLVGYNNTSYFAKNFLRFYGKSPQEYRLNKK